MTQSYFSEGASEGCPIRNILDRVGDRWSLLVFWTLGGGAKRFSQIKKDIGDISQRMLAKTLRILEQDGYLVRTVIPSVPPQVSYELTDLGNSFLRQLEKLIEWSDDNFDVIQQSRQSYLEKQNSAGSISR